MAGCAAQSVQQATLIDPHTEDWCLERSILHAVAHCWIGKQVQELRATSIVPRLDLFDHQMHLIALCSAIANYRN